MRGKPKVNYRKMIGYMCYASSIESKNIKEALEDEYWLTAIQEKLNQFTRNEVWDLVPRLHGVNIMGTKWICKKKSDKNENITINKARLVVQGYTQVEGICNTPNYTLVVF